MKVILQKDVKDVGRVGDLVNVSSGYARNFLFPRKLAAEATKTSVKEWAHLQKVAEVKKKKAAIERQGLIAKLEGVTVEFKVKAGKADKIFGSITSTDIAVALGEKGFQVDKRDVRLEEPIKVLGDHEIKLKLGEGQEAKIKISVKNENPEKSEGEN